MKNLDKDCGNETDGQSNTREPENQWETSHNKSPLLSDAWKPYQRPRAIVKGQTEVEKSLDSDQCGANQYMTAAVCQKNWAHDY